MSQSLADLKSSVDCRDIAALYLGSPARKSANYVQYHAPWRSDKRTPSLTIYNDGYRDYGTNEHGDAIDLLLHLNVGATFQEASKLLLQYVGGHTHVTNATPRKPTRSTGEPPSAKWQQAARKVLKWCCEYLWSNKPDAQRNLNYLRSERGLTDDTIRHFKVGYNPSWQQFGDGSKLAPGIVIPVEGKGGLWALRVRTFAPELNKYMNATGSILSGSLFNVDTIRNDKPTIFVEGEFDAMLAQQELGDLATVITLGPASNRLSTRWRSILEPLREVFIVPDNDVAGQSAAEKLASQLIEWGKTPQVLSLPQGKDTSEFVVQHSGNLPEWFQSQTITQPVSWEAIAYTCLFPDGVPDSWRSAYLNFAGNAVALIFEMLNEATYGCLIDPSQPFTLKTVLEVCRELGYDISESTLRRNLQDATGLFLSVLPAEKPENTAGKVDGNSGVGRKPKRYQLMDRETCKANLIGWAKPRLFESEHPTAGEATLAEFSPEMLADALPEDADVDTATQRLNEVTKPLRQRQDRRQQAAPKRAAKKLQLLAESLDDLHSTPLPVNWPKSTGSEYAAAFAHVVIPPGQRISKREISEKIGVSVRSVQNLITRAGLKSNGPQFEEASLDVPGNIDKQIKLHARRLKGRPMALVIRRFDNRREEYPYREGGMGDLISRLQAGDQVFIRFQVANCYRVVSEEPVKDVKTSHRWCSFKSGERSDPQGYARSGEAKVEKVRSFYGPGWNPQWVRGQLGLCLINRGWVQDGDRLVDPETGEFVSREDVPELLMVILGEPVSLRQAIELEMLGNGYHKIESCQ